MSSRFLWRAAAAAFLSAGALVPAHTRVAAQTARHDVVAIRGGTVLTVTKGTIPNGTVILRNGKIAEVGANLAVPAGADVVDATGHFVTPGIIDAHSHIAADSINESGTAVSSMTGIDDVLDPTDVAIYRDLAGGVTTANVLHGSANPIGGKNAVIKLRWGKTRADDLLFEGAPPGIKFALGENPKDMRQSGPKRYPTTRAGVEFVIRDAFTRAKTYQRSWQEYQGRKKAGEDVLAPRRDLQLEPLVEILEGKRLVHAHCYRADEILMLIRLAEEIGFKIRTFQHVLEGYKVAKEIAGHGAGASTFSDWWGYKIEAVDAIPHNAAIMVRKGVLVSVNSDSAEHARRLNTEAAKSIKWGGLNDDEALALVTINPAKQLRIESRVGSLEPGKDADVVVWNRHPLSSYAIVERTYIDGHLYYDRLAEERRLSEVSRERDRLVNAEKSEQRRTPAAGTEQPGTRPEVATPQEPREGDAAQPVGTTGPTTAERQRERENRETNAQPPAKTDGPAPRPTKTATQTGAVTTGVPLAPSSKPQDGPVLAITNARIHPVTRPTIDRGTIVVRSGRIEAVGADVQPPTGATLIDAAGADVYPGFINGRTTIGLSEPGARGFEDISEMLDFNPQLRTMVSFHPDSDAIPVARANGVTTAAVTPGGGILGGQVAVMNLGGWTWEEAAVRPVAGIALQFPTVGRTSETVVGSDPNRDRDFEDLKKERDAKVDALSRLLDDARAYGRATASTRTMDWMLEGLLPVVDRRVPLIVRADREREIRDAIAFADRAGVRIVISGGIEAPLVAPLLKEKAVPVILGPVLTLPTREDMSHAASYRAAGELVQAGIRIAFATGDSTNVRLLPYHAAQSVAWGLSRDAAIKALTIDAAEILGVADRLGSIEQGKIANLFIAKGDPLEIRTSITHVVVAGQDVGTANRHEALFERFMARP